MDCLIKRIIRHICCLASQIEVVFCTNFLVKFVNVHVIFALGHRARCKFLASLLVAANFGDFGGDGDSPRSRVPARARLSAPAKRGPDTSSRKPAGPPTWVWEERLQAGGRRISPFQSILDQASWRVGVGIGGLQSSSPCTTPSPKQWLFFLLLPPLTVQWKLGNKVRKGALFSFHMPPKAPRLHPHPFQSQTYLFPPHKRFPESRGVGGD